MFSTVTEFLNRNPQLKSGNFPKLITEHLMKLEEEIDGYFSDFDKDEHVYL